MREILDEVDPERLRDSFGDVFRQLQRGKTLEPFVFYAGAHLLSLDGTGYFSSPTIHCDSCQVKEHRDGSVTYQHQMLGAVIVHPEIKEVIPLAPEPIQKQDGQSKNDCERNAAKRLLPKICGWIFWSTTSTTGRESVGSTSRGSPTCTSTSAMPGCLPAADGRAGGSRTKPSTR
jgi:hypothetical protein